MLVFLSTLVGFFMGMGSVLLVSYLLVMSERTKLKKEAEAIKLKQEDFKKKYESVRPRLRKAADISNKQLELYILVQEPSKNSLHSKVKNGLIHEIRDLEKEKRTILRSIIKEGFDPDLDLIDDKTGEKQMVKLSEYMNKNGISLTDDKERTPLDGPEGSRLAKGGKFFVIDGGKSDTTH